MMMFFDFHHHAKDKQGIYNLNFLENPVETAFSVGFHPKDLGFITEKSWEWFKKSSLSAHCLAIGECGLDAFVPTSEKEQEEVFSRQILWANEIQKPVIIHCVRRFSELLRFSKIARVPLIIHGFNKKETIAKGLLDKGFYLSFGRAVLHNLSLQEIVKNTPIDRFFLETDNTDFNIEDLYRKVAALKGISLEDLQEKILQNRLRMGF